MKTLQLLEALIARESVTPSDAGCQDLIAARLEPLGFIIERLDSGPPGHRVSNLFAKRVGQAADAPVLLFAGHTDVVPTGRIDTWTSAPFVPSYRDGRIYGRGAADMKGSVAAMVVAAEEFVATHPDHAGTLALLLTSDEEGPAIDGTQACCEVFKARGERLDCCIVGEPTSVEQLGDMIKNGRRGTLSGRLNVRGVQGHVAYPQLARNPIHQAAAALAELVTIIWDAGNDYFPATSFQISNLNAGTGATNVIPGEMVADFNFRFSTESTPEQLRTRVHDLLDRHGLDYTIAWTLGGEPFLTPIGSLSDALTQAIEAELGRKPALSTTGGTSDGRFIAKLCPQVIEFGPINATIHKIDENIPVDNVEPLKNIYRRAMALLLA
ncbi:MAG TPA: succinyl-diaminopimelate desuccinylase [Burkholderiaceae bacterium]|jgi:succinyl-diaminopimelate desuccinylase